METIESESEALKHITSKPIDEIPYGILRVAFEYHFDVFGLIEKGLAIERSRTQ